MRVYGVNEIKEIFSISDSKAYEIIRKLNQELEEKGYMVMRGRVSADYFEKRFFGGGEQQCP